MVRGGGEFGRELTRLFVVLGVTLDSFKDEDLFLGRQDLLPEPCVLAFAPRKSSFLQYPRTAHVDGGAVIEWLLFLFIMVSFAKFMWRCVLVQIDCPKRVRFEDVMLLSLLVARLKITKTILAFRGQFYLLPSFITSSYIYADLE